MRTLSVMFACLWTFGANSTYSLEPRLSGTVALPAALSRLCESYESAGLDRDALADSAASILAAEGYLDATVTWTSDTLDILAGPRCLLAALVVDGQAQGGLRKMPFTSGNLQTALLQVTSEAAGLGHLYAQTEIDSVTRADSLVTVYAHSLLGPLVRLRQYRLQGLTRTDEALLKRYLTASSGDTLTASWMRSIEQEAAAIPFVRFKPSLAVVPLPGYTEADVALQFEELKQFEILGGLGRVSEDPPTWLWNLDIRLTNLFGSGRRIALLTEQRERDRRQLRLSYGQPLFLTGGSDLSVDLSTRDYRDDFYEFALRSGLSTRLGPDNQGGLALSWRHIEPSNLRTAAAYSSYTAEFVFRRDGAERRAIIRKGFRLEASLAYAYRRYAAAEGGFVPEREGLNETRARLGAEFWQPLHRTVTYLAFAYQGIETGEALPPLSELILIGGPGSLRGYRNEQFAVARAATCTIEPRLTFAAAYASLFADVAYLNLPNTDLVRAGFGGGLTLINDNRSVRLSLGWGHRVAFDEPYLSLELITRL